MTRSPSPTLSVAFESQLTDLLWSLWAELGVSGWTRRHQEWAIDPEPTLILTSLFGDTDPRLRDEALDWSLTFGRYISANRLKNLLRAWDLESDERWGRFAATVNTHGQVTWPAATTPLTFEPTGRTKLDDFTRAALLSLRLRARFGVGARAEIFRYFVTYPTVPLTAADVADFAQFTKRNVEKELEGLRVAGVVAATTRRNRLEHRLSDPAELLIFAGNLPRVFPRWDAVFPMVRALWDATRRAEGHTPLLAMIELRRAIDIHERWLANAGLAAPSEGSAASFDGLSDWCLGLITALATADATALGWSARVSEPRMLRPTFGRPRAESARAPVLVDATDLTEWASRRDAQQRLPQLVRKLILTTIQDVDQIHFPSGEAVQLGGWDGELRTTAGNAFVPRGHSVWEMGVTRDVRTKAESDYRKRTTTQDDETEKPYTSFVFVTPRRWMGKQTWAREKTRENAWRDVRAYDADDLEAWLELSPSTHVWLSGVLGKAAVTVRSLETFWDEWRDATRPKLPADVVTAGREDLADALLKRLRGEAIVTTVQAPSQDEVLAFLAAAFERAETAERDALFGRTLVIDDRAAWAWAVQMERPLILVPLFQDADLSLAARAAHHVLVPTGPERANAADLQLPRIRWDGAREAFVRAGEDQERAERLAGLARNSLTALRRQIAVSAVLRTPPWAQVSTAATVIPALLAGGWNGEVAPDREYLMMLADQDYAAIEREIVPWGVSQDPPVRRTGAHWRLVSKEDAWHLLFRLLTSTDLQRFSKVVLGLLGTLKFVPPLLDSALVLDQQEQPSEALREGIVDTIAALGARSGEYSFPDGLTGQEHAKVLVRELLERASGEPSGRLWSHLSHVLPQLAEAAADEFLTQVGSAIADENLAILGLFQDRNDGTTAQLLGGSVPHTGLLWALEAVAWSTEYLGGAALVLAQLARLDPSPGSRLSNRPPNSLRAIFLPWFPQTSAPLSQRVEVLDLLRKREPDVAWKLLLGLAPVTHGVAFPSYAPRWRDWQPTQTGSLPPDLAQATAAIVERLIEDVGTSGTRWQALIALLGKAPDRMFRSSLIKALDTLPLTRIVTVDRLAIWAALRSEISQHQRFPTATWALDASEVKRLIEAYARLTPEDRVERYAWLFERHPPLVDRGEPDWSMPAEGVQEGGLERVPHEEELSQKWRRFEEAVEAEQSRAVEEVYASGGLPLLLDVARRAKEPWLVGRALGRSDREHAPELLSEVCALLNTAEPPLVRLAQGYVDGMVQMEGPEWPECIWHDLAQGWTAQGRAHFLVTLPNEPRTWDWAAACDDETEQAYWTQVTPYGIDDQDSALRAASNFLRFARPLEAIVVLGMRPRPHAEGTPELVAQVLEQALHEPKALEQFSASLAYEIGNLFDYLQAHQAFDRRRVAQLEWAYLSILDALQRSPRVLRQELARNPAFFVEILSLVFRGDDEEPSDISDNQKLRAQQGFRLLYGWRSPIPGQEPDGSFDAQALDTWVNQARQQLREARRAAIGDDQIGQILSRAPVDEDGVWPVRPIRDVIEGAASEPLDTGFIVGRRNTRGVTTRGLTDGGDQERALVAQYLAWAHALSSRWPRTASILRKIAESYASEARRQDVRSTLREDSWR